MRTSPGTPIVIVGSSTDPHVQAVVSRLPERLAVVNFDAASIQQLEYCISADGVVVESMNGHGIVSLDAGHRGWIRRPLPADWNLGTVVGSKQSVVNSSWQTLVVSLMRNPGCEWLTPPGSLFAAECKVLQLWTASRLGIRTPPTSITAVVDRVRSVSDRLIAKPLGVDQFWDGPDQGRKVFARHIELADDQLGALLTGAPFILQDQLTAGRHLRLVTVGECAWAFELNADGLPLDWREEAEAHFLWRETQVPDVAKDAVRLCAAMGIGYSSQDWIETKDDEVFFVDLNPGGQWLFLPDEQSRKISDGIASWLTGQHDEG